MPDFSLFSKAIDKNGENMETLANKSIDEKKIDGDEYPVLKEPFEIKIQPEGGALMMRKMTAEILSMNRTGTDILQMCDGKHTVDQICMILAKKYSDTNERVGLLVDKFLKSSEKIGHVCFEKEERKTASKNYFGNTEYWTPTTVNFELTMKCNLRCRHCYADAGFPDPDEMSTSEIVNLLESFWKMGVKEIMFTGGEAACRSDLFEILDFCNGKFNLVLITNGWLVDDDFAEKLSKHKITVEVSLDGANAETHDGIRGVRGSFERVVSAIRRLSSKKIYTMAAMIVTPLNISQIEDVLKLAHQNGASKLRIGKIIPSGRAKGLGWELDKNQLMTVAQICQDLSEKYKGKIEIERWDAIFKTEDLNAPRRNCGAGYKHVTISPLGYVRPCLMANGDKFVIGDARHEKFEKIMAVANPKIKMFHKMDVPSKKNCNGCKFEYLCKGCVDAGCALSGCTPDCKWAKNELAPN